MPAYRTAGLGWIPDLPDRRDRKFADAIAFNTKDSTKKVAKKAGDSGKSAAQRRAAALQSGWKASQEKAASFFEHFDAEKEETPGQTGLSAPPPSAGPPLLEQPPAPEDLPPSADLRYYMSPIENQLNLGSCTAHAVIGLVEYLQIVTQGQYIDASRLFLYKTTRDLLQWTGDTGAYIRETIKAMALFGACPETYLPYDVSQFDYEPSNFCYSFAGNYKALSYYRLANLTEIKQSIAQGYPVAFGFMCYESLQSPTVEQTGKIPYPVAGERTIGGHAVLAVGYDDAMQIGNSTGAVIIRNSWGTDWGDDGYGYIPYDFFAGNPAGAEPIADDYWTMTQTAFVDLTDTQLAPFRFPVNHLQPPPHAAPPLNKPQPPKPRSLPWPWPKPVAALPWPWPKPEREC